MVRRLRLWVGTCALLSIAWLLLARLIVVIVRLSAMIARLASSARILFLLELPREFLILVHVGVRIIAAKAGLFAPACWISAHSARDWRRIAGWCAVGWAFTSRVCWFCRLVPLRLLGVDVDEKPLAVLRIPYCFPPIRYPWWGWALQVVSLNDSVPIASHVLLGVRSLPCWFQLYVYSGENDPV